MAESRQYGARYTNFEIVYQLQNQIRIKAPCLYQDLERTYILEKLLGNREAIELVQAVPEMASVAIHFDSTKLPVENLLILLDSVLTNIGSKTKDKIQQMHSCSVDASIPETKFNFAIKGMSCSSCALFLEMVLKRDACVSEASVDFISATAQIKGRLAQEEITLIVKRHGFEAELIDEIAQNKPIDGNSSESAMHQKEPVLSIWL